MNSNISDSSAPSSMSPLDISLACLTSPSLTCWHPGLDPQVLSLVFLITSAIVSAQHAHALKPTQSPTSRMWD